VEARRFRDEPSPPDTAIKLVRMNSTGESDKTGSPYGDPVLSLPLEYAGVGDFLQEFMEICFPDEETGEIEMPANAVENRP
jgi:hypothetical protein